MIGNQLEENTHTFEESAIVFISFIVIRFCSISFLNCLLASVLQKKNATPCLEYRSWPATSGSNHDLGHSFSHYRPPSSRITNIQQLTPSTYYTIIINRDCSCKLVLHTISPYQCTEICLLLSSSLCESRCASPEPLGRMESAIGLGSTLDMTAQIICFSRCQSG